MPEGPFLAADDDATQRSEDRGTTSATASRFTRPSLGDISIRLVERIFEWIAADSTTRSTFAQQSSKINCAEVDRLLAEPIFR